MATGYLVFFVNVLMIFYCYNSKSKCWISKYINIILNQFVSVQYLNTYLYFHQDGITTYILLHDYNDYKNNAYICWGVFTMLTYVRLSWSFFVVFHILLKSLLQRFWIVMYHHHRNVSNSLQNGINANKFFCSSFVLLFVFDMTKIFVIEQIE